MIASSADMYNFGFGPLIIGAFAGIISTLSFKYLTNVAEKVHLYDTRGIVNLHAIPAFFGAIIWSITTYLFVNPSFGDMNTVKANFFLGREISV